MTPDQCAWCGALAVVSDDGTITWAAALDSDDAYCAGRLAGAHERTPMRRTNTGWLCPVCGEVDTAGSVSYDVDCEHEALDGTREHLTALDVLADLSRAISNYLAVNADANVVTVRLPAACAAALVDEQVGGITGACATLREIHDVLVAIEVV